MSELRKDPIIDRWVIVASERGHRPNEFSLTTDAPSGAFSPFAPGHEGRTPPEVFQIGRAIGQPADSPGWRVRVVPNKFPALSQQGELDYQGRGIYDQMNGVGAHEVIIENPDSEWDLADADTQEIHDVLTAYRQRILALQEDTRFRYILVFRNKGESAGASIPHPHSQVIALPIIPKQVKDSLDAAREYYGRKSRSIFTDILRQELEQGQRIVEANDHFVVMSPYASRFPFELKIFPRRHSHDFTAISPGEIEALGSTLTRTLRRIRKGLNNPSYNLMLQTSPNLTPQPGRPDYWGTISADFCWHIDILPRLTSVAGFEWGTGFYINPVSPEQATTFLRDVNV
jgi:UDPglucose--hexose-1-phosphate uridylyltransferase